ncbi:MAG: hypothetical protein H0X39_16710 [Actinobacteria bacterium]|nr:hypothetical protein [Actinomycetota bacterium]
MSLEDTIRALIRDELAKVKPATAPSLVSVTSYAARYQISPSTVRAAIRENRLEVTRIGRAIRIAPDAAILADAPNAAGSKARLLLMAGGKTR